MEPRWRNVYKLWERYTQGGDFSQLDNFLRESLRRIPQAGKRDRRFYAEALFLGARFAWLSLFFCWKEREETTQLSESLETFALKIQDPTFRQRLFTQTAPVEFFFWAWLRNSVSGHSLTPDRVWESNHFQRRIETFNHSQKEWPRSWEALWYGLPPQTELQKRIQISQWSPERLRHFLKHQETRPPLWLRWNHPEKRAEALSELKQQNYSVEEIDDQCLSVSGDRSLFELNSFQKGIFEIQDRASQQVAKQSNCRPGNFVWDMCTGAGGKALHLATLMKNRGAIFASDIRAHKLQELRRRALRAGFDNIQILHWDGSKVPDFGKVVLERKGFESVLIDAPCSGSGTWRRNPDGKLRFSPTDVLELNRIQDSLLNLAAPCVKPGGEIVYATCSWLVEENEERVKAFLDQNREFHCELQTLFGSPEWDSDTLFVARLRKMPS